MTEVKVVEMEQLWVSVDTLMKLYESSESFIRRTIDEMRKSNNYRINVAVTASRYLRVNLEGFDKYYRKKYALKVVN